MSTALHTNVIGKEMESVGQRQAALPFHLHLIDAYSPFFRARVVCTLHSISIAILHHPEPPLTLSLH